MNGVHGDPQVPATLSIIRRAADAAALIRRPASVLIGDVRFLGYTAAEGRVTLFFTPERTLRRDLVVFAHLYPGSAEILPPLRKPHGFFNLDHSPAIPTLLWEKGSVYSDEIFFNALPPGKYGMRFGLYDEARDEKLTVGEGGENAPVIPLTVAAPTGGAPAPSSARKRFSVILCTHNRAAWLRLAIRSLFELDYPRDLYEIVVVDNASADDTRSIVEGLSVGAPVPVTYCHEPKLGLSHARNTGIRHARFDHIAYLDDDAAADRRWLSVFDETLRCCGADVVGGRVVPTPVEGYEPPAWFHSDYVWGFYGLDYARQGCAEKIFRVRFPRYLGGGCSCYRRELLDLPWARFHAGLGRTGKRLYQGEETLLNYFLEKNGYKIFYNADAVIYHFIDPERVTRDFVARKAFWGGYSDALMHRKMFGRRFAFRNGPVRFREALAAYREARGSGANESALFEKKCLLLHDTGYLLRLLRFWGLR